MVHSAAFVGVGRSSRPYWNPSSITHLGARYSHKIPALGLAAFRECGLFKQMNTPYQHIIWDWNGTLLNDTWLCVEVLNELLVARNRSTIDSNEYRKQFGFPVIHFYDYLGFDVDVDSFDSISRAFINTFDL